MIEAPLKKSVMLFFLLGTCYFFATSTWNGQDKITHMVSIKTRNMLSLNGNSLSQLSGKKAEHQVVLNSTQTTSDATPPSAIEPFAEILHPGPLTAKGPKTNYNLDAKQALEKCSFFKDGWEIALVKGDCEAHPTNKHWISRDADVSKVRVLHLVKTMDQYMDTRVAAIKDTWARRLQDINPENRVIFLKSGKASDDPDIPCLTVDGSMGRTGLHKRVLDGLEIVYNRYSSTTDWFNVVDDDIFLVPKLLLRYLSYFDPAKPVLLTHLSHQKLKGECIPSAGGGGGMVMSKAAVKVLIDKNVCPRVSGYDDLEISRCLLHAGVKATCVQDPEGKLRLLSQNLMFVLKGGYKRTFRASIFPRYDKISNPYGQDPFSKELMTWNHNSPEDLYIYDFIYHQHLNNMGGI